MAQDVIAIICDCDGTLCPDTSDRLVRELGIDSEDFWKNRVNPLVNDGWDPPLAYLQRLLVEAGESEAGPLTLEKLNSVGAGVEFYPGALDFVPRLRSLLAANAEYAEANVTIEWFIVSSGIEAVLMATPLATAANEVFGCAYAYDERGRAVAVKRAVTFTEKTKFIYSINKGISGAGGATRTGVNDAMEQADRTRSLQEHDLCGGRGHPLLLDDPLRAGRLRRDPA